MINMAMTKRQINAAQRKRYAIVYKQTGDSKLAHKARKWSDERILNELGVKVTKKVTKEAPLTKKERFKKQEKYKTEKGKFDIARHYGYTSEQALKAKKLAPEDIDFIIQSTTKIQKAYGEINNRNDRFEQWKIWSKHKLADMPPELINVAYEFNTRKSKNKKAYDPNARYGFMMVYYMYVEGYSINWVNRHIRPDKFEGNAVQSPKHTKKGY